MRVVPSFVLFLAVTDFFFLAEPDPDSLVLGHTLYPSDYPNSSSTAPVMSSSTPHTNVMSYHHPPPTGEFADPQANYSAALAAVSRLYPSPTASQQDVLMAALNSSSRASSVQNVSAPFTQVSDVQTNPRDNSDVQVALDAFYRLNSAQRRTLSSVLNWDSSVGSGRQESFIHMPSSSM